MISIILPNLGGGGAERVMLDLAREFARLGHTVEFVLMQATGDLLSEAQRDFVVVDLATPRARNAPYALSRYFRSRKPSAVIANMWPVTSAAVIAKVLARNSCHLMLVEHNTLTQQYASWGRLHALILSASVTVTYRFADNIAAVSEGAAEDTARVARVASERVAILHNPIPRRPMPRPEEIARAEAIWAIPPGQRILTVGNLKDQKNHPLLLRAFAEIARPNKRLMLLGQGRNAVILKALATELGIADRVIFPGFHADPSPFYATADLFVLSSDYEGFGNVIVEALSFGLSVVSTDCPSGPSEILEDGRFGCLVPVGDAASLARAMVDALAVSVDRDALIRRASDFAPEIAARKYLVLLGLT